MDLNKLFLKRKSVRFYSEKAIDNNTIITLLEAARLAPSAVNYQPWRFFVCTSDDIKEKIAESYPRKWFEAAPLYIVACADKSQSWKRSSDNKDHGNIDVAIAITHLILKATEVGLGTCWVCNFDVQILKDALNLDKALEPVAIIPIGHPEKDSKKSEQIKKRKTIGEFTEWM
ncbi:MAG TPA: nitroreductase family protein [Dysgonamonadaceae bacterium]|nr:nitroreductase family protein [Dysgonamonadaceae bacterium]